MRDHTSACQILDTGRCTCRQDTFFNANAYGHICGPGCPFYEATHRTTLKEIDEAENVD